MNPFSSDLKFTTGLNFDASQATSIALKGAVFIFVLAYVFFAFFLYLRVRILSLTLTTPKAGLVRYIVLLHFFAVLGLAFLLGILLLF